MNTNKIIEITTTNGGESETWRNNLSRILGSNGLTGYNTALTNSKDIADLDVNDAVCLCMSDDGYPVVESDNDYNTAIKAASEVTSTIPVAGKVLDTVSKAAYHLAEETYNLSEAISSTDGLSSMFSPWFTNVPVWQGSKGSQTIKYTFTFTMGQFGLWNAKEEVVKPIINLIAPTFPRAISNWGMIGPYPNKYAMYKEVFTQLFALKSITTEDSDDNIFNKLCKTVLDNYNEFTYTVKFGKFLTFNNMMIKDCKSVKFSQDTDQHGYPIHGSVELEMSNIIPPSLTTKGNVKNGSYNFNLKEYVL